MAESTKFPPSFPKPVVVRLWVYMIPSFVGLAIMFVPATFVMKWGLVTGLLLWLAVLSAIVTAGLLTYRSLISLADKARRLGYRLCPSCTEAFDTDEPTHTCTGCKRKINTHRAREQWRQLVLQSSTDLFGPTPHMGKRFPGSRKLRALIVSLLFVVPASQVISNYVSSTPKTVRVPTTVISNSGKLFKIETPKQVPRSALERTAAYTNSYAPLVAGGGIAAYAFFTVRRLSRSTKKAKEHNCLVCDRCLYPLDSCPAAGNCPECGTEYESQALRGRWFRVIAQKEIYEAYSSGEIDEFMPL